MIKRWWKTFKLSKPDREFTLSQIRTILATAQLPKVKILITGNGRVAQGAQHI